MSKAVTLETREQREKLRPRHDPYWRSISRGLAIGYRKGTANTSSQWYVRRYRGDDLYVKDTLGQTDDRAPADGVRILSWSQALRKALADDLQATLASKRLSVSELLALYLDHRRAKSRSALSVLLDEGKLRAHVIPKFADEQVSQITTEALAQWRDALVGTVLKSTDDKTDETELREAKRRAQATTDRVWRIFKAMLNYAYSTGRVSSDHVWRKLKPYRNVDRPRDRFLSVEECRRLLNASRPDFRALVRGALLTGLRFGEITRLKVSDYADAVLIVPAGKGKSRRLPLTTEGVEFFDQATLGKLGTEFVFTRADGKAWIQHDQQRPMQAACKAAKIEPRATFHTLRHTYGSLLVNQGGSLHIISKALGHADTRMTQRVYAHLQEDVMRQELQKALPRIGKRTRTNVARINRGRRPGRP